MKFLKTVLIALLFTGQTIHAQNLQTINMCFGQTPDTSITNIPLFNWAASIPPYNTNNQSELTQITWHIGNDQATPLSGHYAWLNRLIGDTVWLVNWAGFYSMPLDKVFYNDTLTLRCYNTNTGYSDSVKYILTTYKPVICLATTVSNQRNELLFDINHVTLGDTIDVFRDNDAIGTLVYDNTVTDLIYVDSSLNQNITKKYKYTASIRGTCRESWVNTIYLRYSGGNLVWNDYELDQDEGAIDGYSVYRISNGVTDSIYRMERGVDDINGIYEFTDLAYVPGDTYFVTAVKTDGCATSKNGNSVITSNKVTVGAVGINEAKTIDQTFLVLGQHQGKLLVKSLEPGKNISVLNLNGQIVGQKGTNGTIEFNLPVGIYFVTDGITTKKAVVF